MPTVVDEAYYELEDNPRPLTLLLKEYPNLIISRTLSKAWGIAGFRLGYSLASEEITDYLTKMRINFSVGTVNMTAAMAVLDDTQYFNVQNNETKKLRRELEGELCKIEGLRVFHSDGNFILMDGGKLGINAQEIIDYLLNQRVQIRPMTNPPLGPGFFRITIGNHEQNMLFVKKLKQFLSERKS